MYPFQMTSQASLGQYWSLYRAGKILLNCGLLVCLPGSGSRCRRTRRPRRTFSSGRPRPAALFPRRRRSRRTPQSPPLPAATWKPTLSREPFGVWANFIQGLPSGGCSIKLSYSRVRPLVHSGVHELIQLAYSRVHQLTYSRVHQLYGTASCSQTLVLFSLFWMFRLPDQFCLGGHISGGIGLTAG